MKNLCYATLVFSYDLLLLLLLFIIIIIIIFPGRPETNIKPWGNMLEALKEGNKRIKWKDRKPKAFWKGNQTTSFRREDLIKCNVSDKYDWNTRQYSQVIFFFLTKFLDLI